MKQSSNDILKNLTILYVEDEEITRKHVIDILTILCCKVIAVETAEEALLVYEKDFPDIILCDVDLPGINGIEFVKTIRQENKEIPIILLTAHSEIEYLMDAIKLHLVDYIVKPLDIKKLTSSLRDSAQQILGNDKFLIKLVSGALYDINKKIAYYENKEQTLTLCESLFLELLLKNKNRTVANSEIFEKVWDFGDGTEQALKNLLNRARKKIGKESIVNVSKIGYRVILK